MKVDDTQRPEYFAFASHMLDETYVHGASTKCLTALSDTGKIQGVVIYDHITGTDCRLHVASDGSRRWLSREMLFWTFFVPFVQWNLRRITGIVHERNMQALKFDLNLGFVIEGRLRHTFDDGADGILLGMLREECRFLKFKPRKHHGQEKYQCQQ